VAARTPIPTSNDCPQNTGAGDSAFVGSRGRAKIFIPMASMLQIATLDDIQRIRRVQVLTIGWMTVEAVVSLLAAWKARSPALLAFGGDSAIELFSAVVVLWSFRAHVADEDVETRAALIAGVLLLALAAYVAVISALSLLGYGAPKPAIPGIAILVAALGVMPWLAKEKRRLSQATGSAALRADAAQSSLCACLSLIALVGLAVNAIWRVEWADPIAALLIIPLVLRESWQTMRGKPCGCC
jgi:divalent metal cation (Fe/Co/Zn/Cd) transporter